MASLTSHSTCHSTYSTSHSTSHSTYHNIIQYAIQHIIISFIQYAIQRVVQSTAFTYLVEWQLNDAIRHVEFEKLIIRRGSVLKVDNNQSEGFSI
ncbi:24338_t:CDS:2 [Cetraspora pellucida]|uniref:24338_t:CDS:1 n=1 Tax=Cetraspora pellucida TaxID=1433469 RepID=A0A9N9ABS3_9GLOM|nr:24338_t:CDS:2 [Cetraspora pellucida]